VLGGDQKSQLEAMRQYLLTLGPKPEYVTAPSSAPNAPAAKPVADARAKRASR
jgi:hypothetical protein